MIKFILVVMFTISGPSGTDTTAMRAKFDSATECEQAKQFVVEELSNSKDIKVLSADCKKEVDKTA
jgi:hypothetical protein